MSTPSSPAPTRSKYKHETGYGIGIVSIADREGDLIDALRDAITSRIRDADFAGRMLPAVAMRVLELSRSPTATMAQLVSVLEGDAVLAARVLRLACSAAFATTTPARTLDDAVRRLGTRNLGNFVLQASLEMRVFRADSSRDWIDALRKHSLLTGYAARATAQRTSISDECAFTSGLLRGVGAAVAIGVSADIKGSDRDPGALLAAISAVHEDTTQWLVEAWGLPPELRYTLQSSTYVDALGFPHPVGTAVRIGDLLAREVFTTPFVSVRGTPFERAVELLGITPRMLDDLRTEVTALSLRIE